MLRYAPLALLLFAVACGTNADPQFPTATSPCGNAEIDQREQCDDGNSLGGDGCSPFCLIEEGWSCDSVPSACGEVPVIESTCGDGRVQGAEECDDFNLESGDGCSVGCLIEDGFICAGEPSVCGPEAPAGCGDGIVDPTEDCDDANTIPGDGCSSDCTGEDGFICQGEPSVCTEVTEEGCGNGRIEEGEECDDANVSDADGCSIECTVEPGFRCFGEPSVCEPVPATCGDGLVSEGELCDDGNRITGDGCSRQCEVEDGWVCRGQPSDCLRADELCLGVDCSELSAVCVFGVCDPGTGECIVQPATDGFGCDDGDVCTDGDACIAGACTGGAPLDCTSLDSGCSVGVCDSSSGECVVEALSEGDTCDDDPSDCESGTCISGDCIVETMDDCATCGDEGDQFCAAGVCGGLGGENSSGFEDSTSLPAGFASADWIVTTDSSRSGTNSVRSGAIGAGGTTTITQTVELFDAGEVSFWYRVSSESCCDKLRFGIDGIEQAEWGGVIDWTNVTYPLTAGTHTLAWAYTKDGSLESGEDAAWVDDVVVTGGQACEGNACAISSVFNGDECIICDAVDDGGTCEIDTENPCLAYTCEGGDCVGTPVADETSCDSAPGDCTNSVCLAGTCTDTVFDDCTECGEGSFCAGGVCGGLGGENRFDFEEGRAGFVNSGTGWALATDRAHEGSSSLRSGTIASSGTTGVTLELEIADSAEVSFFYSVSSESCCDGLRFFVDGAEVQYWRGEIAFTEHVEPLGPGTHILEWRYTKDSSVNSGSDAAWIDTITVGGITYCEETACGAPLFDGESCVTCSPAAPGAACDIVDPDPCLSYSCNESGECAGAPVADFTVCDADPTDCTDDFCFSGVCTQELYEDCTTCGDTGSGLCASGVCGGTGTSGGYDFEDGAVPSEFVAGGTGSWAIATDDVHTGSFSTRSPVIAASQNSSFTVEVEMAEAGSVSFWYAVSSESCCDGLDFTVDGTEVDDWRGVIGWTEFTQPLEAGTHTLTWRYFKDSSVNSGLDAAWVDDIVLGGTNACPSDLCGDGVFDGAGCISCPVLPEGTACDGTDPCLAYTCSADGRCEGTPVADGVTCDSDPNDCLTELCVLGDCLVEANDDCAECAGGADLCMGGVCGGVGLDLEYDFETGFPTDFVGSGASVWEIDSTVAFAGASSGRNGDIADGQDSILDLTVELIEPGEVSFWHRESTESTYDSLEFYIDGALQDDWDGTNDWAEAAYPLTAGIHVLRWRYEKDGSLSSGSDTVWVDDIRVIGGGVCDDSGDECAPQLFDGDACQVCFVADGTACSGGTCSVGICE
ncbi:MAG: cysteine-rich repeat protein [Bradymonadia bacterium]|jgi:cysteine-rich repeat protein